MSIRWIDVGESRRASCAFPAGFNLCRATVLFALLCAGSCPVAGRLGCGLSLAGTTGASSSIKMGLGEQPTKSFWKGLPGLLNPAKAVLCPDGHELRLVLAAGGCHLETRACRLRMARGWRQGSSPLARTSFDGTSEKLRLRRDEAEKAMILRVAVRRAYPMPPT